MPAARNKFQLRIICVGNLRIAYGFEKKKAGERSHLPL
jgi:hypothetical protein